MKQLVRSSLESVAGKIPDKDWEMYENQLILKEYKAGEIILDYDEVCSTLWHLVDGSVRKTEINNGINNTTHFCLAPSIFNVLESALTNTPSELRIICEKDCKTFAIEYKALEKLFVNSHHIERVGRIMTQLEYLQELSLRRMFLKMDSLQRYEYIEKNYPLWLQNFQLKDLATFIGIKPETLSRIRKSRFEESTTQS